MNALVTCVAQVIFLLGVQFPRPCTSTPSQLGSFVNDVTGARALLQRVLLSLVFFSPFRCVLSAFLMGLREAFRSALRAAALFVALLSTTCDLAQRADAAAVTKSTVLLSIGLVADNHYDTFPAGEKAPWEPMPHWLQGQVKRTTNTNKRRYDIAKDKMDEAIDVFNRIPDLSLVVNLGDIVNNDVMWNLRPILDSFNRANAPHFHILGNHDLRAHNDRFGKDNKTQETWVRQKLGLASSWYYRIVHPPFVLLFLDSMAVDPEQRDPAKKQRHQEWLRAQLVDAAKEGLAVMIFAHISIGLDSNVWFGSVIKEHSANIVAMFFGHEHRGGYLVQRGIHCVIIQGQIETLINAFAVLQVFPDRLELTGFGRVPTRVMAFSSETANRLLGYNGLLKHDIAGQGFQPLPPSALWKGETLQKFPPLNLNIPNYRKPRMPPTDPNPGDTLFLHDTYSKWPRRVRRPSHEDPVDLTSYRKDVRTMLTSEPDAFNAADDAQNPQQRPVQSLDKLSSSSSLASVTPVPTSLEPEVAVAVDTRATQKPTEGRRSSGAPRGGQAPEDAIPFGIDSVGGFYVVVLAGAVAALLGVLGRARRRILCCGSSRWRTSDRSVAR